VSSLLQDRASLTSDFGLTSPPMGSLLHNDRL